MDILTIGEVLIDLTQTGKVTLVKLAPMGDPMELRIHGYELTLRLDDAARIGVTLAKAPAVKKAANERERTQDRRDCRQSRTVRR